MKNIFPVLLVTCIAWSSCSQKISKDFNESTISLMSNVTDSSEVVNMFNNFELVTLETTAQSLFGGIDKLIVGEDNYFILDKSGKKKIFVFSKEGAFIRTIGKVGKGPGEYMNIEDFTIDEATNNVIVLSYPSIAFTYDILGQFINQKKLTSAALLWNICSYKDGYICSSNHHSVTKGEEAFLLFDFDKNFNLRNKLFDVSPFTVTVPPFVSNSFFQIGDKIAYLDVINNNLNMNINSADLKTIHLDFEGKEVPLESYTNAMEFFTKQSQYRFFIDAIIADNVLYTSFANCGTRMIATIDLNTHKISTYKNYKWFANKMLYYKDKQFFTSYNPLSIIKDCDISFTKKTMNYPLEINSNPAIVTFQLDSVIQ